MDGIVIMANTQSTGIAYADPEFTTCFITDQLGYATGAQGTVTQATDKGTAVTLNKSMGRITMNNAALAGNTAVTFTLNNNLISANDTIILSGTVSSAAALAQVGIYPYPGGMIISPSRSS